MYSAKVDRYPGGEGGGTTVAPHHAVCVCVCVCVCVSVCVYTRTVSAPTRPTKRQACVDTLIWVLLLESEAAKQRAWYHIYFARPPQVIKFYSTA